MFFFFFLSLTQITETLGSLGKGQKRKASQLSKAITIGSSPILYTQPAVSAGKICHYTTSALYINDIRNKNAYLCKEHYYTTRLEPNISVSSSAAPLMSAAAYWGVPAVAAPLVPCEPPAPPVPALPPQPPLPPSQPPFEPPGAKAVPTDKIKKVKKDKVSTGINILHQVLREGTRAVREMCFDTNNVQF